MSFSISALTLDQFDNLPRHVRRCVFWEVDPENLGQLAGGSHGPGSAADFISEFDKEAWVSMVLLEWGTCAQVATLRTDDSVPGVIPGGLQTIGTAFYAPPGLVPRARHFPTSPVSPDAVLLTSVRANPGMPGVAESLLQAAIEDLTRRGVRAVEAFGIVRSSDDAGTVAAELLRPVEACVSCMIDEHFLTDAGFTVVAPHPRFPRLRLELDQGLGWKAEVEEALARLLLTSTIPAMTEIERVPAAVPAGASSTGRPIRPGAGSAR
ncbi:hypothetical protein [Jongsikchunia kroppenstedtii]|uniref:hypothetical protein n=1 Tax=Jongsikchunia kroppenstedtii TaxID=1121721 RepID=UPI00037399F3|nr:hypothetical protein [Jongsikchunia kroppenstedtii]